eukprot:605656-Alexandrium_andersonii.AAC.1
MSTPNMQTRSRRSKLELFGSKNGLVILSPKLPRGAFGIIFRDEPDGDDEIGQRARRRRFSEVFRGWRSPAGKAR